MKNGKNICDFVVVVVVVVVDGIFVMLSDFFFTSDYSLFFFRSCLLDLIDYFSVFKQLYFLY